jgi:hypothetical protein
VPDDDTIVLRRPPLAPPPRIRSWRPRFLAIGGLCAVAIASGTWSLWPRALPEAPPPPLPRAETAAVPIVVASEAAIAAHVGGKETIFRLAENPRILIIDYPSMNEQARALDRVAAFVEKAALPRDRVLDNAALAAAVANAGGGAEGFYNGHDYDTRDLTRFFVQAGQDGIALNGQEQRVRALLRQEGLLEAGTLGAVLSVPQANPEGVDPLTRRVILRHELSHGEFFVNPDYAAFVRRAWEEILSPAQQAGFTHFLQALGYDMANHDLVVNEMQAFLLFTPDTAYFSAPMIQASAAELAELQARFLAGMPACWLRDLATTKLPP